MCRSVAGTFGTVCASLCSAAWSMVVIIQCRSMVILPGCEALWTGRVFVVGSATQTSSSGTINSKSPWGFRRKASRASGNCCGWQPALWLGTAPHNENSRIVPDEDTCQFRLLESLPPRLCMAAPPSTGTGQTLLRVLEPAGLAEGVG